MNVMEVSEELVRQRLRSENPEFKKWEEEHQKLEHSIETFEAHRYLSPEEEMERKRLQKLKLAAKDKMAEIMKRSLKGSA
jgi:hypothetical protein